MDVTKNPESHISQRYSQFLSKFFSHDFSILIDISFRKQGETASISKDVNQ